MNDGDIRAVLKKELIRRHAKEGNTLVLEELGIKHGTARIDLVVMNNRLHGYEIKSDRDDLRRLPDQIRYFSSVMDRVTLVVGYRHAYDALKMVPEWWGVKLVEVKQRNGTVALSDARSPHDNPEVDLNAVAALLWRDEALAILEELGAAKGIRSKPRAEIYRRLVEVVEPDYLRLKVRQQLRSREMWRAAVQQTPCGD